MDSRFQEILVVVKYVNETFTWDVECNSDLERYLLDWAEEASDEIVGPLAELALASWESASVEPRLFEFFSKFGPSPVLPPWERRLVDPFSILKVMLAAVLDVQRVESVPMLSSAFLHESGETLMNALSVVHDAAHLANDYHLHLPVQYLELVQHVRQREDVIAEPKVLEYVDYMRGLQESIQDHRLKTNWQYTGERVSYVEHFDMGAPASNLDDPWMDIGQKLKNFWRKLGHK